MLAGKHPWRAQPAGPGPGPPPAGEAGLDAARGSRAEQKTSWARPHRDAQRVEELCTKNHQLREQQKALKENVRVLENR